MLSTRIQYCILAVMLRCPATEMVNIVHEILRERLNHPYVWKHTEPSHLRDDGLH